MPGRTTTARAPDRRALSSTAASCAGRHETSAGGLGAASSVTALPALPSTLTDEV